VKEAKREQTSLELSRLLLGFVQEGLAELRVGATEVGLKVLRCLVRDLQRALQDRLGNNLGQRHAGRLRGDEEPEVLVCRRRVGDLLDEALQPIQALQPGLHQVQILEHHPIALLRSFKECVLSPLLLTLPHRNVDKPSVVRVNVVLQGDLLDVDGRVDSGEQHEKRWDGLRCLLEDFEDVEGTLLDELVAHHLDDEDLDRRGHPIGPKRAEDQQLVERLYLLKLFGQVGEFGLFLVVPLLPLQHVGFQRTANAVQRLDLL